MIVFLEAFDALEEAHMKDMVVFFLDRRRSSRNMHIRLLCF